MTVTNPGTLAVVEVLVLEVLVLEVLVLEVLVVNADAAVRSPIDALPAIKAESTTTKTSGTWRHRRIRRSGGDDESNGGRSSSSGGVTERPPLRTKS